MLVLIGIFLAGGVTGALVIVRFGHRWVARHAGPEQWGPNHLKRLTEHLDLKPEQAELIQPIIHRHAEELNRVRATSLAETRGIFDRMEQEISAQLTPEQRAKFEQMNKEMRERAKRFLPDRRPRSPGENEPHPGEPGKPDGPPPDKPPGG